MEPIASYARTRAIIETYGITLKKNFGQNFLVDGHVLGKIIQGADINKADYVIEIGPGIGGLTQALAEHAGAVTAVEIDKTLIPVLEQTLQGCGNIELLNQDILKTDISALIRDHGYTKAKIVSNLPYYVATNIIMGIFENHLPVASVTVMVQKEVGDRIRAKPSTKDYGSLTLAAGYYAQAELIANVPRNSFIPRPNIDSVVLKMTPLAEPPVAVADEKLLFQLIRAAFGQRRKTLLNCIFNQCGFGYSKDELQTLLVESGIDANARGEQLDLAAYARLANVVKASLDEK